MVGTVAKVRKVVEEQAVMSPTIGLSWFKALEAEFKKPYFAALSAFVTKERSTATIFPSFEEVWACGQPGLTSGRPGWSSWGRTLIPPLAMPTGSASL